MTFWDYVEFIYLNTNLANRDEAKKYALFGFNHNIDKIEMVKRIKNGEVRL